MRILIYSYNYYPEPIGIAPLMTELAEGLAQRGHQVCVVTAMPNYPERRIYPGYQGKLYLTEHRNGVLLKRSYVWIRPRPKLLDRLLLDGSFVLTSFPHALIGGQPEIILATVPPLPVCLPATFLGWLRRCPVVLNIQDIQHEAAVQVGLLKNKLVIRIFAALEKFAYRTANKITVIADGFTQNLLQKGVPPQKIVLIPNWVDINFIKPLRKETNTFRNSHQLQNKFVVLYSGNIALTQGLNTVIKASYRLQNISDIVILIVGENRALDELRSKYPPGNNVLLLPLQPRTELPEMLNAANVSLVVQKERVIAFNMPSKIPVILASGCPIIASVPPTGTAAHAIENSGGGVLVPPENPEALATAILDLYNHPEKIKELGENGRKYAVENYNFEQRLNQYEELFLTMTSK